MPEIEFRHDVLAPEREWVADFKKVHKPTFLLSEMNDMAKWNWRVTSSNCFTDRVEWDVTTDPVSWLGEWRFRDKKDMWSTIWIRVICQGEYDPGTKTGSVTIKVRPWMITKFKWENPVSGMLYWFYFQSFYKPRIREYIDDCQNKLRKFDAIIREKFGINPPNIQEKVTRRPRQ